MAVERELLIRISADVAAAQSAIGKLQSSVANLQRQASTIKLDFSKENITAQFSRGVEQLKANFRAGLEDVSTGVLGTLATNLGTLANPAGLAAAGIAALGTGIKTAVTAAIDFDAALTDVSVITGKTGGELRNLGEIAKQAAMRFGGDAKDQLGVMSITLSKIGPQLADNAEAFGQYNEIVNVFAKAAGVTASEAASSLADVLLQLGVNTQDASEVLSVGNSAINAIAKGAQIGAATTSQIAESLLQVGSTAKTLGIGVVDLNAALQALSLAGKAGSEAGVGLRNVLLKIANPTKEAQEALAATGVTIDQVTAALKERGIGGALEALQKALRNVGSDAERAALLAKLFGAENVAAAGGLLMNVDAYKRFRGEIEQATKATMGQGAAYEQAATRMKSWSEVIARVKATLQVFAVNVGESLLGTINAIMPIIEGIGSGIRDAFGGIVQAISPLLDLFGGSGNALRSVSEVIGQIVRYVLTLNPIVIGLRAIIAVISAAIRLIVEAVSAIVRLVVQWVQSSGMVRGVMVAIQMIVAQIKSAWQAVVKAIEDAVAWLSQTYNWLIKLLRGKEDERNVSQQVTQQTQQQAAATQDIAQQTSTIATNYEQMLARLQQIMELVERKQRLYEQLVDLQMREAALQQGTMQPTLEMRIDAARRKMSELRDEIMTVARVTGRDVSELLAKPLSAITVDELLQIQPALKRYKDAAEDASQGADKQADAQRKYNEELAKARQRLQDMVLRYKELSLTISELAIDRLTQDIKSIEEQAKSIDVQVSIDAVLRGDGVQQAIEQLDRLRLSLQDMLQVETRPAIIQQINSAIETISKRRAELERNALKARDDAASEREELLIKLIADEEQRQRESNARKLEQERDYTIERMRLHGFAAEQIAEYERRMNEQIAQARTATTREMQAMAETQRATYATLFEMPTQLASELVRASEDATQQFKRIVLSAMLDLLEANLYAGIFGVTAQEVASKGIIGLGTSAVAVALLRALFAAAKAAIQRGFKLGGWTGNVSTNAVAGVVHGREFVVRAPYAERWRPLLESINAGASPTIMQRVRVTLDGSIAIKLRDGWIDAPRYAALRLRGAV